MCVVCHPPYAPRFFCDMQELKAVQCQPLTLLRGEQSLAPPPPLPHSPQLLRHSRLQLCRPQSPLVARQPPSCEEAVKTISIAPPWPAALLPASAPLLLAEAHHLSPYRQARQRA